MTKWSVWLVSVILFSRLPDAIAAPLDEEGLLASLRTAHRSALQSIDTFQCEFTIEEGAEKPELTARGGYWRSARCIRVRENYVNGATEDVLVKDSEVLSVGHNPSNPQGMVTVGRRT